MFYEILQSEDDYRSAGRHRKARLALIEGLRTRRRNSLRIAVSMMAASGVAVALLAFMATEPAVTPKDLAAIRLPYLGIWLPLLFLSVLVFHQALTLDKEIKLLILIDAMAQVPEVGNRAVQPNDPEPVASRSEESA
jgi:hypothetical protein